jgi:D-inositol-3-phosphate glycosyltransferase
MPDRRAAWRRLRAGARKLIAPPGRRPDTWPPPPEFFDVPRGYVDQPSPGAEVVREPVQLLGWCLFPGASVERVEVSVNFGEARRARLGMPRLDLSPLTEHPEAPVCGFEYVADFGAVGELTDTAVVSAVAYSSDGRRHQIDPVSFRLVAPRPTIDEHRAAELRARSRRYLPQRRAQPDGRIRMLAFSHQLVYGGASLYLYELLRRFAANDNFECALVALEDGPLRRKLEMSGIPVHLTDGFPVCSAERYEGSQAELLAWVAPQGFNVAFVNSLACFSGAEIAHRLGIPSVWAIHESFRLPFFWMTSFTPGTLDPYVPTRAERSLRDAAAVMFEAEATRRLYLSYADRDRLITEPYGVELADIAAAQASGARAELRRGLGISDDAKVLLCLGSIEARKSQAMLVDAFARVAARHPDALLVLVGETGAPYTAAYVQAIREYIARAGLGARVRIEPVTSDPYPWHLASDVHVCASDVESLPRSVLEAMAFERPVVSTAVFGVPEVIDDGRSGYLCDTRDAAALARRLDHILAADPADLRRMTAAASAKVRRDHDSDRYADRIWRLITALVDDPSAEPRTLLGVDAPGPDPRAAEMRVRSGS